MKNLLFTLLFVAVSYGAVDTLTLKDCLERVSNANLEVKAKQLSLRSSELAFFAQTHRRYPSLSYNLLAPQTTYLEQDEYFLGYPEPVLSWKRETRYSTNLNISTPTVWGGKITVIPGLAHISQRFNLYDPRELRVQEIFFRIDQPILPKPDIATELANRKSDIDKAIGELDDNRLGVLLSTANAYIDAYIDQRRLIWRKQYLDMGRIFIAEKERDIDSGDVRESWGNTVISRVLLSELDIEKVAADMRLNMNRLRNLMNIPQSDTFALAEPELSPLAISDSEVVDRIVQNDAIIEKIKADMEKEQAKLTRMRRLSLPDINIVAYYALQGRGSDWTESNTDFGENRWGVGLSFGVPIFDAGADHREILSQQKKVEKLKADIAAREKLIATEAHILLDKLHTAKKRFDIAQKASDYALDGYNAYQSEFKQGKAERGELLDGFRQYKTTMENTLDAKSDFYKTLCRIKILTGEPLFSD